MEMERPHPVWTGYSGWPSVGFFGSCCIGLKRRHRSAEWIGILVPPARDQFRGGICFGVRCSYARSNHVGEIRRNTYDE